jgi:6-phosphogluconolactonase
MSTSDGPSDARRDIRWVDFATLAEMQQAAYRRIIDAARRAIAQRGEFLIVLAGGNTPRGVYRQLRDENAGWSHWNVYFGDERCLPVDDAERNSKMAATEWLNHVPIPKERVHPIPAELGARAAALAYADTLRGVGQFDLVLLGLGEDGHTASLFPNHDWGTAPNSPEVLAVLDAPKSPPQRVSLSAARLSRAREVLFLVAGDSKREPIARWRAGEQLPAAAIRPAAGVDVLISA